MSTKEFNVNVATRRQRAVQRINGDEIPLHDILQQPDAPFPRLENFLMTLQKNPYAAIGAMIAVGTLVMTAVVGVAASMFAAVFIMHGTISQATAKLDTVIKQQEEIKTEYKVMRTYEASTLSRQNFMVGLMTLDQQKRVDAYDKNHPRPDDTLQKDKE